MGHKIAIATVEAPMCFVVVLHLWEVNFFLQIFRERAVLCCVDYD
jgi:hypothetical protein